MYGTLESSIKDYIEQKTLEEQVRMKAWVKEVTSEVVQVASNDQRAWFSKRITEVKNIFNVPGLIGPVSRDHEPNPYEDHQAFVRSMHNHKLAFDSFQTDIMKPIQEL